MKKRIIPISIGILILFIGILLLVRADAAVATIEIEVPKAGSVIFVDADERARTEEADERITLRVREGDHAIVIAREDLWPWTENVEMAEGEMKYLKPFTLAQNASGFLIGSEDREYDPLITAFEEYTLPDEESKLISPDGTLAIWIGTNGRQVLVEWLGEKDGQPSYFCKEDECFTNTTVFIGRSPIRGIFFLPERSDVIVIAMEQGVFAVEIDPEEIQNFQLLDSGEEPRVLIRNNEIYTLDNESLKIINI